MADPTGKMSTRWEWRTFGHSFGAAEAAFATLTPGAIQESDELYLVGTDADTVKVRFELLDVKTLREVDAVGLERWEPVLKATIPIAAEDVGRVLDALRVERPTLERESYSLEQFLTEIVAPADGVCQVQVHKRRARYTVAGAQAELTDVVADGHETRTIAVESEDPALVRAAIEELGLTGYVNTAYPRGITALLEERPARYAVIDIGTNSVKFHVGERDAAGEWQDVMDRAVVTRLGEGLGETGEIGSAALDRTVAAIVEMVDDAKRSGVLAIAAVGTAGMRSATNSDAVVAAIEERAGVAVTVISGDEEARLAFLATKARLRLGSGTAVVFDTGGGSTQFTFTHDDRIDERFSLEAGAVRYTERFGLDRAVSAGALADAKAAIAADLARLDGRPRADALVAMGGTVTNITAVMHELATYDPDVVSRSVVDLSEVDRQIELYRSRDAAGRRGIVGLQPARADVILGGACIVRVVMELLGHESLTVSDRGLRHGLLVERFGA
jgi:exopolyphosphatase/guanosine-5'-triphosphate,3'-diphosphate pyrophosphatase